MRVNALSTSRVQAKRHDVRVRAFDGVTGVSVIALKAVSGSLDSDAGMTVAQGARMISMLSATLALTLASAERPVSVWTEPFSTVALVGVSLRTGQQWFYVPVGVGFFIGDVELQVEATLSYQNVASGGDGPEYETWAGMGSLGAIFHRRQGDAFDGFFISPKVYVEAGHTTNTSNLPGQFTAPYSFWNVQAAVDGGYRWVFGHFEMSVVAGAGAGYGLMPTMLNTWMSFEGGLPKKQFVMSVNLNLLRLGFRF